MKWSALFLLFCFCWTNVATLPQATPDFVFTYTMASHCKEHLSKQGYSYDKFYAVNADDRKRVQSSSDMAFEMHMAIQAVSNGHILLSPVPSPTQQDPVYEIVVGGGGNKFTELRRNLKRNAKASQPTVGVLSAIELRGFYIKISTSGMIEFGKEGSVLPIISYFDTNPLDIKYFSFASWNGVEAKFLYDCPAPGSSGANQTLTDSKAIKRKVSNSEQLKSELLEDRPPHIPPGPKVKVSVGVLINAATFNAFESKLTTRMSILTSWKDESLAWNPDKFNNITKLTYRQGQIWRPTFQIYNSDSLDALRTTGLEVVRMTSSGDATFYFKATVDTWCYTESPTLNKWPHDTYKCSIVIQPWEAYEIINLVVIEESALILQKVGGKGNLTFSKFVDTAEESQNEWKILDFSQTVIPARIWNQLYPSGNNYTHQSDRLVIQIELERNAKTYNIVFYTPLLVLVAFVLMSFWSEPLQWSRIWFYAGASIVICFGLCYIDNIMPCHTVPSILVLYITIHGGILLALVVNILLMTTLADKLCNSEVIQNKLSNKWFRIIFCLPVLKVRRNYNTINEGYSIHEEDGTSGIIQEEDGASVIIEPQNGNVEQMQEEGIKHSEKAEFAEALDKVMFFVFSIVWVVLLSMHF